VSLPLLGEVEVVIEASRPVSIHGDAYHDLQVRTDGGDSTVVRVPAHVLAAAPDAGTRIRLSLLMGQVQSVAAVGGGG